MKTYFCTASSCFIVDHVKHEPCPKCIDVTAPLAEHNAGLVRAKSLLVSLCENIAHENLEDKTMGVAHRVWFKKFREQLS